MSTTLDVEGEAKQNAEAPVKKFQDGNPRRIRLLGGLDFWFDLAILLFWLITRGDDYLVWRLENCGETPMEALASMDKTWGGTSEGLLLTLAATVLVKELLAVWVAWRVLGRPYRSNLTIQSSTSVFGYLTEICACLTQDSPSVGNPADDDPDNPTILEDINVTAGCCWWVGCGDAKIRSWWMTLCLLENTVSLVFAMHSVGTCMLKTTLGLIIVIGSLLTTIMALVTRALRITSKRAGVVLPGIRHDSSFFGATEHGDLEEYTNCAVLTSDLSGFTKTTKEYGIVFMASVIQRMRQISLPIAYAEKPHSVGFEADDLIIVFRDVETAFRAAAIINYLVIKNREDAPTDEIHFAPKLGGVGIHFGPKILKHRNGSQLYGATAAEAYHLGEEMAEKELIISEAVYKQLTPECQRLFKEKVYSEEDLEEHIGKKPKGPVFARDFKLPAAEMLQALDPSWKPGKETFKGSSYGVKFADPTDMSCLPDQMSLLMQIQWPQNRSKDAWNVIADKIKERYSVPKVALLCDIQFSNDSSPTEQVTLEGEREKIVNAAIIPNKGVSQDDKLTMFDAVKDATLAVIALRRGLWDWNNKQTEERFKMKCEGYGIHKSDCLVIPETDVHWGYAVNAASKIGEDCGEDGEILLTDTCYDEIKSMSEFKDVFWIRKDLEASGNHFVAFQLNESKGLTERTGPNRSTNPEPDYQQSYPELPGSPKKKVLHDFTSDTTVIQ